ncbi:restriction endonuclease subunit S [Escherichia coli]|uniref:restriction endonuclease subunit S n=1 Tax=Escherichia coli TaxID=562 RepID=UPI0002514B0C|nr:restriction endonuclease subunit S [Escherichia coli]HEO8429803.1 restriction endonuclease subunit S [Escherichia coli 902034 (7b)]EFF2118630.1 restriction endonuclease subunit S [Escherichia coli]EFF2133356.1 restriction endonuclease subunit S [Escherichia coli]EFF2152671.1 restriction endonuclease subunit S [Escherichia coli]EFF2157432.1 restriction endonuclease subunit S [Escherichia coli]
MSNLKRFKFSEFGEVITGKTPSSAHPEDWGNDIPFITPSDSFEQKYINSTQRYLSSEGVIKLKGKLLPENSVLVTCIGSAMGKVAMTKAPSVTNQQINAIKVNSNHDPSYIYYCLKNNYKLIRNAAGGSTALPLLNKTDFERLSCNAHVDKIEQRKISLVLSLIDEKIALNSHINTELEAMAKTLYDYWFVQFDFPDANGKPYKTSGGKMVYNAKLKREIPAGWSSVALSKVTAINNQSLSPADYPSKIFCYYSIPVYDLSKSFSYECGENIGSNKFIVSENDLLVSKLNPWFNRVIYTCFDMDAICSTEFVVWRTSNVLIKNFLYMIATSPQFIEYCTQSATGTSNSHKRVNPDVMMRYEIPFDSNIAEYLGEKLEPIIRKLLINQQENTKLIALRDWLLPLLMNRQVTVK